MPSDTEKTVQVCNCLALRQAARHVTQFYDQCLAPTGLTLRGELHGQA